MAPTNEEVVAFEYNGVICGGSQNPYNVPENVTHVQFHPSVTELKYMLPMAGRTRLKEVVLNEGLKIIGKHSFRNCKSLQRIIIPSSVLEIGRSAFEGCVQLRELVFHEGIKKIEKSAFSQCSSLESISLPSTLNEIGDYSFLFCSRLREIHINNERMQIGDNALYHCRSLQRIKLPSIAARLEAIIQSGHIDIISKIDRLCTIGITRCGSEIFIHPETPGAIGNGAYWKITQRKLYRIVNLITYYETVEATTLFEMALWKSKIDQYSDRANPTSRMACRIEVPGPVKDAILQYANPTPEGISSTYNQIFIRSIIGQINTYDAEPSDTITYIKDKIREDIDVSDRIHLFDAASNTELEDNRTLSDYNIQMESTLYYTLVDDE